MSWHTSVYTYQVPFALVHLWILIPPDFLEYMCGHTSHPWPGTLSSNIDKQGGCVHIPIFLYLFYLYLFYLVIILWMWLEGNFAYGTSALLPWHVYTSVVNQLESHYSDEQPMKWSFSYMAHVVIRALQLSTLLPSNTQTMKWPGF